MLSETWQSPKAKHCASTDGEAPAIDKVAEAGCTTGVAKGWREREGALGFPFHKMKSALAGGDGCTTV